MEFIRIIFGSVQRFRISLNMISVATEQISIQKNKTMKYTYLIIALSFLMLSCQREEMEVNNQNPVVSTDPMIKVEGSVVGMVMDEEGEPVIDAVITLGNDTRITNEFGNFIFKDQELYADGTYMTIKKPGYFPGSRRFNAIANEQNNVTVRLIEKIEVGNFAPNMGEEIEVATSRVVFPAGNYTNEDGSNYSGTVHVFAKYLDPTKEETFEEMPGDLVGADSEGALNALATFGMVAVELENDNGEKVNLPEGENALLRIGVPDELLSVAPATIPLWHFDEDKGVWLEEGEANLENGVYVGEVSHFSFWNCDYPLPIANINGIVSVNGRLAGGLKVVVTDQSTGFSGCGTTSSGGGFGGGIPQDVTLTIEVLDPCGNVLYEDEIGPFSEDTTIDPINISTTLSNVLLSGVVSNCTGETIDDSAVVVNFGSTQITQICEDDGTFEFFTPSCLSGEVEIFGVDITNSLISPAAEFDITQTQNVGTLIACEDFVQDGWFIDYENINWGMDSDSSLVGYSIEIDTFFIGNVTNIVLKYYVIDWELFDPLTQLYAYNGIYSYTLGEDTAELEGQFQTQGFNITGTASYEEINQAGQNYIRLNYSTSDVDIIDDDLYPGDVGDVKVFLTIPIN